VEIWTKGIKGGKSDKITLTPKGLECFDSKGKKLQVKVGRVEAIGDDGDEFNRAVTQKTK